MSKTELNLKALVEAVEKVERYSTDAKSASDFYNDQKSFDATMMQFVVIGEVISRLDDEYKSLHGEIPWQKIKDFRNIIAHDYFGVDADEIWDIVQNKLIPLRKEILKLL